MRSTRQAQLFDNAATLLALLDGAEHRVEIANARYRAVIGEHRLPGSAELLTRVLQTGEPATERCASAHRQSGTGRDPDVLPHCIDFVYQPVRNEQGQVTGVFVEGTEVTERVQVETRLRESQAHFKAALSAGQMGSWETDHRSKTRLWSEEGMALFGIELPGGRGQVDGPDDEYVAALHPGDRHLVQRFRQLAAELDSFPAEYRIVRPDGSVVWLSGRGLVVERGAAGQPVRLVNIMGDATARKAAEEQLRTERERLDLALNAGQMGAYDYDVVADRLWWSAETYALFGVNPAEFVPTPQSVIELLHPTDRARFLSARAQAQARREPLAIEFQIERPDGRTAWLAHRGQMEYDAEGRAVRSFGISMDVTERRLAEQSLRSSESRLRALADNMPQMAWMADAAGRIEWVNQRWVDYTGLPLAALRDGGWKALHHPDHRAATVARFERQVELGADWEDTFPLRGKDGTYRWFLSRMKVIDDPAGGPLRFFGTNTDVTEARESAEQLRALSERLSDADRRKDEFLATLAHELRNPLAPVRNSLELMKRAGSDMQAMQPLRVTIERQIGQMVRLIDDLLDVGRITSNKLELQREPVELGAILRQAIETASPVVSAAGHVLAFEPAAVPLALHADPVRLNQVFTNLIVNAAKFSPDPGTLQIRAEHGDGQAIVSVVDTGIGIPPGMLERVFEPFVQVDTSVERARGGLGLGLSLVKRLVEMHGGSARAHSDGAGRGSRFEVRLPCNSAVAPAPEAARSADPATLLAPSVILIADDNQDGAESLGLLLGLEGHETHLAHDGLQAVALAERLQPDVVLLDIGMPKMNGHDACAAMRRQGWGQRALILATTGWGQADDVRRSEAAGFDAHLVKPLDLAELLQTLTRLRSLRGGGDTGRPG